MQSLLVQLQYELKHFNVKNNSIQSVFIGGGTPSTVDPILFKPLFDLIKPMLQKNIEITTEANPNSATKEWIKGMKSLGVNRISFGVQSFNNEKLKMLGRAHNKESAIQAIKNAKELGIENISLDLIYATNMDTNELLQNDLDIAFSLPINHLSAYSLTIEEGTVFQNFPEKAKEKEDQTIWFLKQIQKKGFEQYEISNFGTYKSKHNLGYWRLENYIGLGAGAVGFLDNKRFYPTKSIEDYIQDPLNISIENIKQEDRLFEQFFLGMRSSVGIKASLLNDKQKEKAIILIEENKLYIKDNIYFNNNYLIADELALFLE